MTMTAWVHDRQDDSDYFADFTRRVTAASNSPIAAIRDIRISADNSCRSCDKQALRTGCPARFMADNGVADQKSDYICRTTHALFEGIKDSVSEMLERLS